MLEHRSVRAGQDVLQVLLVGGADPADIRVQSRLPGPVAALPGEFRQVLAVAGPLAAVQPLQPALPADLRQVGRDLVIIDPGTGDQEHLGLHALHAASHYRPALTSARARHSRSTLAITR